MSGEAPSIDASYALCRRMARQSGSSFYPCFFLLGREKRRAMDALYAFMRHTDDLGDNPQPVAARASAVRGWRASLAGALNGSWETPQHPLLPALADTVHRFHIPPEHLFAVIDGVEMDLAGRQYETFEDLAGYCRCVASAVGLACLHVWGYGGDEAREPADKCGLAFQLTNILRDLKEDAGQGRVYLPLEDLRRFQYSPADLAAGVADERFLGLIAWELERAERLYREAARLDDWLPSDGRRIFGMMMNVYYALLEEIRRSPAAVLSRRVGLTRLRKMRIAARWLFWPPAQLARLNRGNPPCEDPHGHGV